MEPAITSALARCPQASFSFMGNEQQFLRVFGDLPQDRRSFCPAGSLDDYYRFLETLDIGIAPLLDNPYNQCRSDIKFVEYASRGVVPVLAAVTPYLQNVEAGTTAFLFKGNAELEEVLIRLIGDADLRQRVAGRAYEYVKAERLEARHAAARLAFYDRLRSSGGERPSSDSPLTGLFEGGGLWDLNEHPAEALLVAGISAEGRGDSISARDFYRQASATLPGYALPLFWHGRSHVIRGELRQAERKFVEAIQVNPRSIRAFIELGRARIDYDPQEARSTLQQALTLFPGEASVVVALGYLAEKTGQWQEAARLYDEALLLNRFSEAATEGRKRAWMRATGVEGGR